MALITCTDLSLAYDGKIVESEVSFAVPQGDYLCIVGENGSGKSTLMKALLGLIRPVGGRIEFGDGLRRRRSAICPSRRRSSGTSPPAASRSCSPAVWPAAAAAFSTAAPTGRPPGRP